MECVDERSGIRRKGQMLYSILIPVSIAFIKSLNIMSLSQPFEIACHLGITASPAS
jgi:hypothetical protein